MVCQNEIELFVPKQNLNSHPFDILKNFATLWNLDVFSEEFSTQLDKRNIWPSLREKFFYPKIKDLPNVDLSLVNNPDEECIYLCGNSLGLEPKSCPEYINAELEKWSKLGVHGHKTGWISSDDSLRPQMAKLAGASVDEVQIMNFLTVNLHFLMISFYQPTKNRFKILLEDKAFPSDHYVVESQIRLHDLIPEESIVFLKPREGEITLRKEDILDTIEREGESIALVFLSGIHYFTGELFDIKEITKAAKSKGCRVGWDLAHAIGNVELKLHDWNVDFAAWCTYKYLNSGPGSIGAIFLHENNFDLSNVKKLDGWWSHRLETRFKMNNKMERSFGAKAYSVSNTPMLLCKCLKASLDIFAETDMSKLRSKSMHLTAYLEAHLNKIKNDANNNNKEENVIDFECITPSNPEQRGAQLSIRFKTNVAQISQELEKRGVVFDFREPDVLRFSPAPLYNTFSELHRFICILKQSLMKVI